MDKARDVVKRGAGRFFSPGKRQTKQSALNGGGDVDISETPKREKIRASSNEDCEMADESEGEEELCPPPQSTGSSKRFKLHNKQFDDCNAVDHAAVPRKLRSAMNKRSCESISSPLPDAKKLHHTSNGMEPHQINITKKSKQNMKQGGADRSPMETVSGPITKDEEEVVETLYALAKMFPNNKPVKNRVDRQTSEAKSPPLQETRESPVLASEAPKEESTNSQHTSNNAEATNLSSSVEGSAGETSKVNSSTEPTVLDQPIVSGNHKFGLDLDSSTALADPQRTSTLSKIEHTDNTSLSINLGVSSELHHGTGFMHPAQHEVSLHEQKPDNGPCPVAAILTKQEQQPIKENKETGAPALWTGSSTTVSCSGDVHSPTRSSSTKAPAWLDSGTSATRPSSTGNGVSTEKVQPVIVDRRQSRKRSVVHVYISRLIQAYRTAENKARWPVSPNQLKPNEGTKLGVTTTNDLMGLRKGLNGIISVDGTNCLNGIFSIGATNDSARGRNLNEKIGIVQDKRLQQNQEQSSTTFGIYTSEKQSCDFLSLSTGSGGLEYTTTNHNVNQGGNGFESSAQVHVPYLHSIVQHHPLMPFSLPHAHYSSSLYPDQLTAIAAQQVQLQLTQYMDSSFYGPPHRGRAVCAQHPQEQQQQQQMWAAQLAAQYRPAGIPGSHLPRWQNGRHESPMFPCTQPTLPSSSPVEVLGAKFSPGRQQQQLFSREKRQYQHLPGGYDEGSGRFHSNSSSHLQLLCNAEHL